MKKLLSIREFARRIGKARSSVMWKIGRGEIKLVEYTERKKGIPESEVKKFIPHSLIPG